ncbi:TPA: hypothetical protein ACGOWL_000844 [Streptococcus suis]
MEHTELVDYLVLGLSEDSFEVLKKSLVDKFIFFSIIDYTDITEEILSEKICDYFEKVELITFDSFDGLLRNFYKIIDSAVSNKVSRVTKAHPTPSRARKYYENVKQLSKNKDITARQIVEYSRIMFCLYSSIIDNQESEITNFTYSLSNFKSEKIVESLINKNKKILKKVNRLPESRENHSREIGVLILIIIILHKILDSKISGEYYHG